MSSTPCTVTRGGSAARRARRPPLRVGRGARIAAILRFARLRRTAVGRVGQILVEQPRLGCRAAAFARVVAAGRAFLGSDGEGRPQVSGYASDLSASRLLTMAEQLEHAGALELDGQLA